MYFSVVHCSNIVLHLFKIVSYFLLISLKGCQWINYFTHSIGKLSPKGSINITLSPTIIVFLAMEPELGGENTCAETQLPTCRWGIPQHLVWPPWLPHPGAIGPAKGLFSSTWCQDTKRRHFPFGTSLCWNGSILSNYIWLSTSLMLVSTIFSKLT